MFHIVSSCFTAFLECWSMPKSAGAVIGAHDRMAARVFFKSMHDVSTGAQGHNIEAPGSGNLESYLEAI
jgi:hypothetical protein